MEGLTNRRFLKTHLPTSALEYSADTKYVYVARDGRDAFMSLMNHYKNGNEAWYGALNSEGLVGDPLPSWEKASENKDGDDATRAVFDKWLNTPWGTHASWEEDGWPFWSLFYNAKTWWEARHLPNVLFVHFGDMKQDLKREMRRIAAFIGAPVDEAKFDAQVRACTFEAMKGNANRRGAAGRRHVEGRRGNLHQQGHERPLEGRADEGAGRGVRQGGGGAPRQGLRRLARWRRRRAQILNLIFRDARVRETRATTLARERRRVVLATRDTFPYVT